MAVTSSRPGLVLTVVLRLDIGTPNLVTRRLRWKGTPNLVTRRLRWKGTPNLVTRRLRWKGRPSLVTRRLRCRATTWPPPTLAT
jgi:hypothetical protein